MEAPRLIYTDAAKVDAGAVGSYRLDMAFGSDEQDFEIAFREPVLTGGELLYVDGTEYGGIVDAVTTATDSLLTVYNGRTWHGILAGKIISPDPGQDYLTLTGDANWAIGFIIARLGLSAVFTAEPTSSGLVVTHYRFARFVDAYTGLQDMLATVGARLGVMRAGGTTVLSAEPVQVIKDEADSERMAFTLTTNIRVPNHLVCMGEGELKDRLRVDLYADADGVISTTQTFFGVDEIAAYYNYSGASLEELTTDGTKTLQELQSAGAVEITAHHAEDWHVGDILEARDNRTGDAIQARIVKKIVRVEAGALSVEYGVGESSAVSSSISGTGEVGRGIAYTAGPGISITGSTITADVTQAELDDVAGDATAALTEAGKAFTRAHPVGSYLYTSSTTYDPNDDGGTWTRITGGLGPVTWHRTA